MHFVLGVLCPAAELSQSAALMAQGQGWGGGCLPPAGLQLAGRPVLASPPSSSSTSTW